MEILEHAIKNQPGDIYHPPARLDPGSETPVTSRNLRVVISKENIDCRSGTKIKSIYGRSRLSSIFPPGLPGMLCY